MTHTENCHKMPDSYHHADALVKLNSLSPGSMKAFSIARVV